MPDFKKEIKNRKPVNQSILGNTVSTESNVSKRSQQLLVKETEKVRRTINISKDVDDLINKVMKKASIKNRSTFIENLIIYSLSENKEIEELINSDESLKSIFNKL